MATIAPPYAIWSAVDLWLMHSGESQLRPLLFASGATVGLIQCGIVALWARPWATFLTNLTRGRRHFRYGSRSHLISLVGLAAAIVFGSVVWILVPETGAIVAGYGVGFFPIFAAMVWYSYARQRWAASNGRQVSDSDAS